MKKFFTILFLSFFFVLNTYAQSWEWGRGSTGTILDSWAVATDRQGNVFGGGVVLGANPSDSITLGTETIGYAPGGSSISYADQSVLSKYDSAGNFLWARATQNGSAYLINIATDPKGNSYILGSINDYSTQIDTTVLMNPGYPEYVQYYVAKFDPSGNLVWAKTEGGAMSSYTGAGTSGALILSIGGIATDNACNVYITTSYAAPTVTVGAYTLTNSDPSGSTYDLLVAKYDSSGSVVWATSTGGSYDDESFGLAVTPAGDIYISGIFKSPTITFGSSTITDSSGGVGNAFIARYNTSGSPVWGCTSGGTGGEYAAGVAADAANNVYLTGGVSDPEISFSGTSVTNPYAPTSALYLVKFDTANNVSWSKTMGDPSGVGETWGFAIAMSPCNNIWVSGVFHDEISIDGHMLDTVAGSEDPVFMAGFNTVGTYTMSAALQSGADDQNAIACDLAGNVYLCADYYTYFGSSFIVANDTFPPPYDEWQYIAKYKAPAITVDTTFQHVDTTDCIGMTKILSAPTGYSYFLWMDGSYESTFSIDSPGTYWVIAYNACGTSMTIDTFYVKGKAINPTDTSQNITICIGVPTAFTAPSGYLTYLWNDGNTSPTRSIDSAGEYVVAASNHCAGVIDSITAVNNPTDTTYVTKNVSICEGVPTTLNASAGYPTYLWDNNSTKDSLSIDAIGTYWVIGFSACDTALRIDTFIVKKKKLNLDFSLGADTIICSPITLSVSLTGSSYSYLWQNSATTNSIIVDQSGTYYVRVSEQGCFVTDTIHITTYDIAQRLDDTLFCAETFSEYTMYANLPPGATALWSTGSTDPSITVTQTGKYSVTVTDAACKGSDSMILSTELCDCKAFLPTAFTPNDDGRNDTYKPVFETNCAISNYEFSIYNRYGQRIYFTEDPAGKWDGTFAGVKVDLGTYMYYLKYTTGLYNIPHETKGDVTLVR